MRKIGLRKMCTDSPHLQGTPPVPQMQVGGRVRDSFKSLPFRLATAPRAFIKLLQPWAAKMQWTGVHLVVYLDDILVMAQSQELLRQHMQVVASSLQSVGFSLNHKRSVWRSSQVIGFLGFHDDLCGDREDEPHSQAPPCTCKNKWKKIGWGEAWPILLRVCGDRVDV